MLHSIFMRADACGLVLSPFKFFSLQAAKNKTCSNIDLLYGVLLSVLHYAMNKIINYTRDVTSDNTRCTFTSFPSLFASIYGLPLTRPHTCSHRSTMVDEFATHPLSCKKSEGRFFRHSAINSIIDRAFAAVATPARFEPTGLLRTDSHHGALGTWQVCCLGFYMPRHTRSIL